MNILRGQNERSHSNYAKINLNSNEANFNNFFFSNNNLEVWFQSKTSYLDENVFKSEISAVSSCNVEDPDWEIRFSKGWLNRKIILFIYIMQNYMLKIFLYFIYPILVLVQIPTAKADF